MKLKELKNRLMEIDADSLGEAVYEAFMEEDNTLREIGKSVSSLFLNCDSEEDFKAADGMLTALTGYSIDTLSRKAKA